VKMFSAMTARIATEAFLAVLDAHTLADLIKPQRVLSSLLLDRRASGHADRAHCAKPAVLVVMSTWAWPLPRVC
jgi:hypothetical protein